MIFLAQKLTSSGRLISNETSTFSELSSLSMMNSDDLNHNNFYNFLNHQINLISCSQRKHPYFLMDQNSEPWKRAHSRGLGPQGHPAGHLAEPRHEPSWRGMQNQPYTQSRAESRRVLSTQAICFMEGLCRLCVRPEVRRLLVGCRSSSQKQTLASASPVL